MQRRLVLWLQANRALLWNTASLIGTAAVTSLLGFSYWWIAARMFPPETVGRASSAISAMTLLGTVCVLGLGTLLIGELPRHPGLERALTGSALIVVGLVGGTVGIGFCLFAPHIASTYQELGLSPGNTLIFALGVGLTAITLVLDQALIGMLRGGLQLGRNTLFSVVKLVFIFLLGLWLKHAAGIMLYITWGIGNLLSVVLLLGYLLWKRGGIRRQDLTQWHLLYTLRRSALEHHLLNMAIQAPSLILPVLVSTLFVPRMNANFYIAWLLSSVVYVVPSALTTVLYATSTAQMAALRQKTRLTIGLALGICGLAVLIVFASAELILSLFGHSYATQAPWILRVLVLASLPLILKNHYIAIARIRRYLAKALLPMSLGAAFELTGAFIGSRFGGMIGLGLGWVIALTIEALCMWPFVYRFLSDVSADASQRELSGEAVAAASS